MDLVSNYHVLLFGQNSFIQLLQEKKLRKNKNAHRSKTNIASLGIVKNKTFPIMYTLTSELEGKLVPYFTLFCSNGVFYSEKKKRLYKGLLLGRLRQYLV